ncbi:hypothetical protein ACVITL_006357 [Rhizobium pisi]
MCRSLTKMSRGCGTAFGLSRESGLPGEPCANSSPLPVLEVDIAVGQAGKISTQVEQLLCDKVEDITGIIEKILSVLWGLPLHRWPHIDPPSRDGAIVAR